jgi:hypothetical protein
MEFLRGTLPFYDNVGWDPGSVPQQLKHLLWIHQLFPRFPSTLASRHLLSIQLLPV